MKKLVLCVLCVSACGGDSGSLFEAKPECMGAAVTPFSGTNPQVMSALAIGTASEGFDLDHDGKPDNKLAQAGGLAGDAIDEALKRYELVIPLELFDFPAVAKDDCVKFAVYLANYAPDKDGDGKRPSIEGGDCNDTDAAIRGGAPELMDGKDNDCDGLADEDGDNPNTTNTADADNDMQSVADGDCDDTNPAVNKKPGTVEICGDGLDNDCDGVADRTQDASGNATACSAYDAASDLKLDPASLEGGKPAVAFIDGVVDSAMKLVAGPSVFSVAVPVGLGLTLDLHITGATIEATLLPDGTTTTGRLGGVIDAVTADTVRGLDVKQIGLKPEDSLLDATFANILGPLLALPKAKMEILKKYRDCRTPDIDVDGDGIEAFCDSNPNDEIKTVDVCIDGDGTEIRDEGTTQCSTAMKDGKPRFVDGISVEMNFSTTKIHAILPP